MANLGAEFIVSASQVYQSDPASAVLTDGRFVIAWSHQSSGGDVRARIFNADGTPAGDEFLVNSTVELEHDVPAIGALTNGGFAISWTYVTEPEPSFDYDYRARLFSADGSPVANDFIVNSTEIPFVFTPAPLLPLPGGRMLAVWNADNNDSIRARVFDAGGAPAGNDFILNTTFPGLQFRPAGTALSDGRLIVLWQSGDTGDGSGTCIRGRLIDADGDPIGSDFIVNSTGQGEQGLPAVAALPAGRFVAAWESDEVARGDSDIRARIFNADGTPVGTDFLVGTAPDLPFQVFQRVDIAGLNDGRFLITWTSTDADGSAGIRARLYNADGTPAADEFAVNAFTDHDQSLAQVEVMTDGRVLVTWASDNPDGIFESHLRSILFDPDGGSITVDGTAEADLITGTPFGDELRGNGNADKLYAGDGDDTITGGDGDDLVDGAGGIDTMTGGFGNDTYVVDDAGDQVIEVANQGTDTVRAAISITLSFYLDHAQLIGSGDIGVTGNFRANRLRGNDGDNVLDGSTGADRMFGGLGDDTYVVDNVGDLVQEPGRAAFNEDTVQTGLYRGRLTANIENLILVGTDNVTARGNRLGNEISGNAGNNWVVGEQGEDTMTGGAGRDSFNFTTAPDFERDTVVDFSVADDIIRLENAVFAGLPNGHLAADAFRIDPSAADAEDRIVYNSTTGQLLYDADGTGTTDAIHFATLPDHLALTRLDFFVT